MPLNEDPTMANPPTRTAWTKGLGPSHATQPKRSVQEAKNVLHEAMLMGPGPPRVAIDQSTLVIADGDISHHPHQQGYQPAQQTHEPR
jgi:hypothetical protein